MPSYPALTLYQKGDSCSFAALSLIHHLSIPFNDVPMKPDANRHYVPADGSLTREHYLKINPTGFVPALVIADEAGDEEVITELPAVLTYIVCLAPPDVSEKLLGATPLERARIAEWMNWLSGTFQAAGIAAYARPYRYADGEEAQKAVAEKGRETVLSCYARVEERLKGREFAIGGALSVVDFFLYLFRRWAVFMTGLGGSNFGQKFPSYEKLARMVEGLDGVQKALASEGLKPVSE